MAFFSAASLVNGVTGISLAIVDTPEILSERTPMQAEGDYTQEFVLSDGDFATIVAIVKERAGIVLSDQKRPLVYGRLARRLRALKLDSFAAYCTYLNSASGEDEFHLLINAITTNLTDFFRESHHFDFLAKEVQSILAKGPGTKLRIWSAGCSSGEEPYSIAMTVLKAASSQKRHDIKILATDIDTDMVARGKLGRYTSERADSIPVDFKSLFANQLDERTVEMVPALKSLIVFNQLNLFESWPMKGPFDIIFCRNVIIYFDNDAKKALFERYAEALKPGGWMIIGHSENLFRISDRFRLVGKTIYQRIR